jgi:hypothetical protein
MHPLLTEEKEFFRDDYLVEAGSMTSDCGEGVFGADLIQLQTLQLR